MDGMSLIELMIAIAISLILMAGIVSIFINSKQAYRIQEDTALMQENSRTLMNIISHDIRMAAHWSGIDSDLVDDNLSSSDVTGSGSCDKAWLIDPDVTVYGYEGAASSPLPTDCIAEGDYVVNTDIIVVLYADSDGMVTNAELDDDGSGSTKNNAQAIFVKTTVGRRAVIDLGASLYSSDADVVGEYNYPYKIAMYFIRPCSVKAGAACASTDDNGSPIPTLTRMVLKVQAGKPAFVQEPLIEGIEQLQAEYGIEDNNGSVVNFKKASAMSAADWTNVISVRLGMVARAESRDNIFSDTNIYRFPDPDSAAAATSDDFTPSVNAQKFHRKQFFKTISIRNRVRS